jgi:DMSO/TMAO reductase YedYZ molybdopterin-dependent catalytic subunit
MKIKFVILALLLLLIMIPVMSCKKAPADSTTSGASVPVTTTSAANFTSNPSVPGAVEATEYLGTELTQIKYQRNNALEGTQHIDKNTYVLTVDGLVDNPLKLTYADLLALPQISKLMPLDCVEGWNFTAKWTGPSLKDLLSAAKVQSGAKIAIFHTTDVPEGYSSLNVNYIIDKNIILGMKINDITMPDERGFPFQVVAESKFGYKWSKWITRIELSDNIAFRGYWEGYGYNNNADISGPSME